MQIIPPRRAVYGLRAPRVATVSGGMLRGLGADTGETMDWWNEPPETWGSADASTGRTVFTGKDPIYSKPIYEDGNTIVTVQARRGDSSADYTYVYDSKIDPATGSMALPPIIDQSGTGQFPTISRDPTSGRAAIRLKPSLKIIGGKNLSKVAKDKNPTTEEDKKKISKYLEYGGWGGVVAGVVKGIFSLSETYGICDAAGIPVPPVCYAAAFYPPLKSQCDKEVAKALSDKAGRTDKPKDEKPVSASDVALYGALAVGLFFVVRALASRK